MVNMNSLLRFIFFKPSWYPSNIFNEYCLSNLDVLYNKNVCIFMFNYKELINYSSHSYATKYNSSIWIVTPPMRPENWV